MIKKTNSNSIATKKDIKQVKDELKKDIRDIRDKFNKKIDGVELSLREEIRFSINEAEERIDEKARDYRDQILTKMDGFIDNTIRRFSCLTDG